MQAIYFKGFFKFLKKIGFNHEISESDSEISWIVLLIDEYAKISQTHYYSYL